MWVIKPVSEGQCESVRALAQGLGTWKFSPPESCHHLLGRSYKAGNCSR